MKRIILTLPVILASSHAYADFGTECKRLVETSNVATRDWATLTAAVDVCGYTPDQLSRAIMPDYGQVDWLKEIALAKMLTELGQHNVNAEQMNCHRARELMKN